jgi:glycosyltransferase involved in cell wall biosynthesis
MQTEKIRICHVTTLHPRDDARILHREIETLKRIPNFDVTLLVADGLGRQVISAGAGNVIVIDLGERKKNRFGRATLTQLQALLWLSRNRQDIVHVHDPELLITACVLRCLGRKIIFDSHEDLPKQIMAKEWIPTWMRGAISALISIGYKNVLGLLSNIVCATPSIATSIGTKNCVIARNYPRLTDFANGEGVDHGRTSAKNARAKLLYVGSISRDRGIESMLSLVYNLNQIGCPTELVIAGQWEDQLLSECEKLQGWEFTTICGRVSRDEVAELLEAATLGMLLLSPTPNHLDALPVKLFEYCAAGLPIVASDYPMLESLVAGENIGICLPLEDVPLMALEVKELILDAPRRDVMSANGISAVHTKWNWESEESQFVAMYKKICLT